MIVVITGGRDYDRPGTVIVALCNLLEEGHQSLTIFHGGARGADTLAGDAAKRLGLPVQVFPADWAKFGKRAGPMRNRQMVAAAMATARKHHQVAILLAFPGGKGTRDCIDAAREVGLGVVYPTLAWEGPSDAAAPVFPPETP